MGGPNLGRLNWFGRANLQPAAPAAGSCWWPTIANPTSGQRSIAEPTWTTLAQRPPGRPGQLSICVTWAAGPCVPIYSFIYTYIWDPVLILGRLAGKILLSPLVNDDFCLFLVLSSLLSPA